MAFKERFINVTFTLGEGSFGNSGANTEKIEGHRISAKITKAGGPSMGTLEMQVFGMSLSQMNKLSTLGLMPTLVRRNVVTVEAGDSDGVGTVFIGTITNAWADFKSAPEVAFYVEAHTGLLESVKAVAPSSFTGPTDVGVIMSSLATTMGLAFENSGVSVKLSNPYFPGSARDQTRACAEAANIEWIIDNGKLAIWPKGGARGGAVPLLSPATGLVGYPSYTSKGVILSCEFNPNVGYGGKIQVESSLTPAKGEWIVFALNHDLAANMPNGPWFSEIQAARPGLLVVT